MDLSRKCTDYSPMISQKFNRLINKEKQRKIPIMIGLLVTLKQASSALGMMFSPQLGSPSHARLSDMQRRPFFCWNCSSVGHSYSAPSEAGKILNKMKASCLSMNYDHLSSVCQGQNLFYVLSSNIILFLLSGPQIPI